MSPFPGFFATVLAVYFALDKIQAKPWTLRDSSSLGKPEDIEASMKNLDQERGTKSANSINDNQAGVPSITKCSDDDMSNEKVIGGHPAPLEWKIWFVELYEGDTFICGGTRISHHLILTAAHCFFVAPPHNGIGRNHCSNLTSIDKTRQFFAVLKPNEATEERRKILRVYKHKRFSRLLSANNIYTFDLAIGVLESEFDASFKPGFCLLKGHGRRNNENAECYAVGVGYKERAEEVGSREKPHHLLTGEVNLLNCRKDVESKLPRGFFPDVVCTTTGGTKGDSGGPVLCDRPGHKVPYLLGIISQVNYNERATILHNATMEHESWVMNFIRHRAKRLNEKCSQYPYQNMH